MTDRSRLDAVLKANVDHVPRPMCCTTCTVAEVKTPGTYAYYHAQDIERAFALPGDTKPVGERPEFDGAKLSAFNKAVDLVGPLFIGFGIEDAPDAMPRLDEEYDALGARLVAALNRAGFGTKWTGSANQRIEVTSVTTIRQLA